MQALNQEVTKPMASYTMPLRDYIEMWSQDKPDLSTRERIEIGRTKLFDFPYPIFDEKYRKEFETKFIRNFYMKEIGFETEELFKFRLENWLTINMPYFNNLYISETLEYDPLINSQMKNTHNKKNTKDQIDKRNSTANVDSSSTSKDTGNSSVESTDDNFERRLHSDTPDSRLRITTNDGQGVIEYATTIDEENENNKRNQKGNSSSTSNSSAEANQKVTDSLDSDIKENEDYIQERIGKIGVMTYPDMVQKWRKSFLRIDKQVFDEMNQLFMLVY